MRLLGSSKNVNELHLEIAEVILNHENIFNKSYHQNSRPLYTCVPYESFVQLIEISTTNLTF